MSVKFSSYSMFKRLLALFVLVAFFGFAVVFRLFYLQVISGYSYVEKGLTEWLRDLPLTAVRGSITDRNGVTLASSYTTYDVYVRPADVEDSEGVSQLLSDVLGLNYDEVYEKVTKKNLSEIKIKSDIEKSVVQKLLANFKSGLFFTTNIERNYSYDELLCQILGFVGSENFGQGGLEAFYNSYLAGVDGVSMVESDMKGSTLHNSVSYYCDAIDGLNLKLTIDFRLQNIVENILKEAWLSTSAKSVSCIVTNPQNGEILSIATLPSYNLNEVPRDDMEKLNSLSRASCIVDTFEPGSTFKILVCAIALEEGLTYRHNYFYCGGFRIVNGVRIRCSRRSGHGSQSLEQGLMNSCNCVFMDLIARIGTEKFYDYLEKFGLTSTFGLDFPGEVSAVLMPKSYVTDADLARMGFGQSIAVSAMQLSNSVSAVINGGYVYQPYFVKEICTQTGKVVFNRKSTVISKIFSESTSQSMREMLHSVVEKGGGKYAKVEGYPIIAGKTGTAQKYENGKIAEGKYIASFIGFAPYYDPKYQVLVVVDEPQGAYYGGVVAAPVAQKIFTQIFDIFDIDADENDKSEEKNIELPTLVGMTLTQAASVLAGLNLQYLVQGKGDYVTAQIPAPGTMMSKRDIVLLIFD